MSVVISGMGHCSAVGQGLDSLRRAWLDGSVHEVQTQSVLTARGSVDVPVFRVPSVTVPKLVPEAVERRMSRFSKIGLVTLAEALMDAQVDPQKDSQRIGLIIGTAFGNLDFANDYQRRVLRDGPAGASPSLFAASIHNSLAAQMSLAFGIRGPNSTIATMEQTGIGSMRLAYDWIQEGVVDRVAIVIGDELSEYHLYYLAHHNCSPAAGEGMHAFILEREDCAQKKYARVQAPVMAGAAIGKSEHAAMFGQMVTGVAFDMGLAALAVERSGESVTCVQSCPGLADQAISFSGT